MTKLPKSLSPGHGTILSIFPYFFVSLFASFVDSQAIVLALPSIQKELNIPASTAQWLMTIHYIATASCAIPLGRLGDRFGYVPVIAVLALLTAGFEIGFYFAKSFIELFCVRIFVGAFSSGQISNRNSMMRILPAHEKAHSFLQQGQTIVQLVGVITPIICGLLVQYTGYKNCYMISAVCYFVTFVLVLFYTNPKGQKTGRKNDLLGSVLIMVAVGVFCLSLTLLSYKQYWQSGVAFGASVVAAIVFYFVEKKHSNPIIPIFLMKNPVTHIVLTNINTYIINAGLGYILPQFLSLRGIESTMVSIIFAITGLFTFIFSMIIPIIQKKVLNRRLLLVLQLVSISLCVVLFFVSFNTIAVMTVFVLLQLTIQITSLVLYPLTMMSVPKRFSSQIGAIPTTGRTVGQSISYCLFSMVSQLVIENSQIPDLVERQIFGYQISFLLFIPFLAISTILIWFKIGMQENESHKKGFRQDKVRKLQVAEFADDQEEQQTDTCFQIATQDEKSELLGDDKR
ncbi:Major facilitator superfamily protein [Spironucleus salmonicida]|uniref:Major facilitator superfamily protein n=1 Tax=Spironucleus salmonicida TaxID=348837 RepID=V6LWX1_9EUKA|nr:Major facilitator superfamily protein [Spironucleus salmonicida]|eukprot:EST48196.1 Major facilitator superfamily protein [Spironucleus salmonicida]